jgi:hypothetical protein
VDFKTLWEMLTNPIFVKAVFKASPPTWFSFIVQPLLFFVGTSAILGFLWRNLNEPAKALLETVRRLRSSPEERNRIRLRHEFARHMIRLINIQNEKESWSSARFTDLEADYYVGNRNDLGLWRRLRAPLTFGPARVKTIASALQRSSDKFALIEGDPGGGKTVILREVTARMCKRAAISWSPSLPVALYFNLKKLDRNRDQPINSDLVRQFVSDQMRSTGSSEAAKFFDQYFDQGVREGWWAFLFDSFDEIPDVLSAEDTSTTIDLYSQAILSFATDFNGCRTILATRHFRRPKESTQPRYRVLPLSARQRNDLIQRALLSPEGTRRIYAGIANAGSSFRYICENPMYLSLLIEFVRGRAEIPTSAHDLFGAFITKRLEESSSLLTKANADAASFRGFTELVAFCIVEDARLGLNPTRKALLNVVIQKDRTWRRREPLFDLLEELRLARGEPDPTARETRFTFSHRRFQEYFSTSYALRSNVVSEADLLFEARWRETASVLLGSGPPSSVARVLTQAEAVIAESVTSIRNNLQFADGASQSSLKSERAVPQFFLWPDRCLHILSIFQDGYADDPERLSKSFRTEAGNILRSAAQRGRLEDCRLALEVAGILHPEELTEIVRLATARSSRILDDVAFQQLRNLPSIPEDVATWIRQILIRRAAFGEIARDRRTILTFFRRFPDAGRLYSAAQLLSWIPSIDNLLHLFIVIIIICTLSSRLPVEKGIGTIGVVLLSLAARPVTWLIFRFYFDRFNFQAIREQQQAKNRKWWERTFHAHPSELINALILTFAIFPLLLARIGLFFQFLIYIDVDLSASDALVATAAIWALLGWAPMAIAAVISGEFTAIRYWPLLGIYPLLWPLCRPRKAWHKLKRHFAMNGRLYLVYAVTSGGAFGLLVLSDREDKNSAVQTGAWLGYAMALVYASSIFFLVATWLRDWRKFKHFQDGLSGMAGRDFLASLGSFALNSFRIRFIRLVAAHGLLPATEDTLTIIQFLSLALDRDIARDSKDNFVPTGMGEVDEWRNGLTQKGRLLQRQGLKRWGPKVLDELTRLEQRLREQVQARSAR